MSTKRTWEDVTDPNYFHGIIGNILKAGLGPEDSIRVRLGLQGDGVRPNYQLHGSDGQIIRFNGANHRHFHDEPFKSFESSHISEEYFNLKDIQDMLGKLQATLKPL